MTQPAATPEFVRYLDEQDNPQMKAHNLREQARMLMAQAFYLENSDRVEWFFTAGTYTDNADYTWTQNPTTGNWESDAPLIGLEEEIKTVDEMRVYIVEEMMNLDNDDT